MKQLRNQKGFTLVELAIVLVIIGIILGGVLKGQQMINSAREKKLKQDIDSYIAAIYSYMDKYALFPGDDNGAAARWGATDGDADGRINDGTQELEAWDHLRRGGFIAGSGTVLPRGPYGSYDLNCWVNFGNGGQNCIRALTVPAEAGENLDIKYDDGIWNTGLIRANAAYTAPRNLFLAF